MRLLSCCFHADAPVDEIIQGLSRDSFYSDRHQWVFAAIHSLRKNGVAIDPIIVGDWLAKKDVLLRIGGAPEICKIVKAQSVTVAGWRQFRDIVLEKAAHRDLLRLSSDLRQDAELLGRPIDEILSAYSDRITSLRQRAGGKRPHRSSIDPWVPFPLEALPEPLRLFVIAGAATVGCDEALLAVPLLSIVAGAIGNSRRIRLKRGWSEPSIIWSAIVADSGSMKSPALELVAKPIQDYQSRIFERHESALAEYEAELAEYERDLSEYKKSKGNRQPPVKPVAPVCRRFVVSNTTIEALAVTLGGNPRGVLGIHDELAGWFGGMNQYKKGGADVAQWLELHRAGTLTVDRKSGPTIHVRQASVSLTGTIQPGILARSLTAEYRESGLAARFLFAMPPKGSKRWSEAEISESAEERFRHLIERLLTLELRIDADGNESPWILDLTPEAKKVWVAYYNRWGREQAEAEGDLAAVFAKIEAYAARFALLHHVVEHVHRNKSDISSIGVESIEAGIKLADWFAREVRRVYASLEETKEEQHSRRLVDLIHIKGGSITVRELQRQFKRKYLNSDAARKALLELQVAGLGSFERVTPEGGGRPSERFVLVKETDDKTDETLAGIGTENRFNPTPLHDNADDKTLSNPSKSQDNRGFVGIANCRPDTNEEGADCSIDHSAELPLEDILSPDDEREVFEI